MIFVDKNDDSQLNWTDTNANGVYDRGEPGEVIAHDEGARRGAAPVGRPPRRQRRAPGLHLLRRST